MCSCFSVLEEGQQGRSGAEDIEGRRDWEEDWLEDVVGVVLTVGGHDDRRMRLGRI